MDRAQGFGSQGVNFKHARPKPADFDIDKHSLSEDVSFGTGRDFLRRSNLLEFGFEPGYGTQIFYWSKPPHLTLLKAKRVSQFCALLCRHRDSVIKEHGSSAMKGCTIYTGITLNRKAQVPITSCVAA